MSRKVRKLLSYSKLLEIDIDSIKSILDPLLQINQFFCEFILFFQNKHNRLYYFGLSVFTVSVKEC